MNLNVNGRAKVARERESLSEGEREEIEQREGERGG